VIRLSARPRPRRSRPRHVRIRPGPGTIRRLLGLTGAVTVLAALAVTGAFILNDRRATIDAASAELIRSARLSTTLVDQIVRDADAVASGLQIALQLHDDTIEAFVDGNREWLEAELATRPLVRAYSLTAAGGDVIATTIPELEGRNLAGRDYFEVHTRPNGPDRFVSEPILSRLRSAYRLFLISWPLRNRDGEFLGVFAMSLDTARVEALLGQVDETPHDALSVVTTSGMILASQGRGGAQALPSDYREPLLIRAARRAATGPGDEATIREGYLWEERSRWLVAAEATESIPASVVAARDLRQVLAPWRGRAIAVGLAGLVISALSAGVTVLLRELVRRQDRAVDRATRVAETDPLTGLLNRRGFADRAAAAWRAPSEPGSDIAVLVLDLDHFKVVNDTYGHDAGDTVLREVAERLRSLMRQSDVLARTGGEEFALVLPETRPEAVPLFAERLRRSIEKLAIGYRDHTLRVTVSIGIRIADPAEETPNEALRLADDALYVAKRSGRNRAVLHGPGTTGGGAPGASSATDRLQAIEG